MLIFFSFYSIYFSLNFHIKIEKVYFNKKINSTQIFQLSYIYFYIFYFCHNKKIFLIEIKNKCKKKKKLTIYSISDIKFNYQNLFI